MAYGVPFQSPPSRQSVAALLGRLSKAPGMATGGKPAAAATYVAPQNPSVATPYTGNIDTYGQGPEHDFFVTPAAPPPPKPVTGGGDGGVTDPQHPFGGTGDGSRNPWNQPGGDLPFGGKGDGSQNAWNQPDGGQSTNPLLNITPRIKAPVPPPPTQTAAQRAGSKLFGLPGIPEPTPDPEPPAQTPAAVSRAQQMGLIKAPAQQPAGGAGLSSYLQSLQGYTSQGAPRNMAVGGQPPDPSDVVAAPQQNVEDIQGRQGDQMGGLNARDQANADVAAQPSLKNAIGIGSMVAGMAMAPLAGLAMSGLKLAGNAILGNPMSSPFDTPGPRVTPEQQQQAIDAYNSATGPITNKKAAYTNSIGDSRTIDNGGQLGGPGPGLSAGVGVDAAGHTYGSNIGGAGVSHNLAGRGESVADGGDRAGGGYGGQGGDIGSGRGDMDGGGPDKGGLYRRGGVVRNYGRGGALPRFPSIKRFDQGGGYVSDPASDQTVDSIDPGTTDATPAQGSSGIDAKWIPLMTGAYSTSKGDPYAGAASIGVATQMMGGTPQDAMDTARLLYKSGASQQPKAQKTDFDASRGSTNSLLSALASQAGVANQLRAAAIDPESAMTTQAQPYAKPAPRGSTISKATGGNVQGEHPDGILSDGHSFAVKGPGSGQSDDINAKLSNDEHVIDATTIAALGDGSSDEGHRRMDQLRVLIRKRAGMKNPKKIMGKQPGVAQILARVAGGRV